MSSVQFTSKSLAETRHFAKYLYIFRACFAGLLLPLAFAPFHFPGLAILGLAILFAELQDVSIKQAVRVGFIFGGSFMGFGVSWVFISINLYGNLNVFLSVLVTVSFIIYLSAFYIIQAAVFNYLRSKKSPIISALVFSAIWCLCEFLRAIFASGFPWLLIGFGQVDSPLQYLLPYIGIYGVSFLTCLAACFLTLATKNYEKKFKNSYYLIAFLLIILSPITLKNTSKSNTANDEISVGIIQANLSMRDKWDEALFTQIINRYRDGINKLKSQAQLIVLPESAIPVPQIYARDFLEEVQKLSEDYSNQILIGIPKEANQEESLYYNTVTSFGTEQSIYLKQHLVPFGEYIPKPFNKITKYLGIPDASMIKGPSEQPMLKLNHHPFVTLICFEIAYPNLLRKQLPKAQWIVAVSDDGWFGHSLAIYQQLQMSQALSLMTNRYQLVANNNGLSSIIDNKGRILISLPAFSSMNLYGKIKPAHNETIWVTYGDKPYLYLCIVIIIIALFNKRRYPCKSTLH